jgi:transcriptional regulator with XRE-family HTH domain
MDKRNHAEQAAAKQIGARIRQRRLEMGMSMQQLSEQLGLNASTIRRYEKEGLSPDKRYLLIALADRLDTDVDWLMGREPEQPGLRTGAYAQYARQLNVRVGQFLQGLKKLDLSGEQQTLLVGVMGCFLDYFSTVAAYYVRALGAAAAPSDREDVFRREMREPVSGLHAMADCLLHLDQPDMQQNFTLLLRSAADGRPLRRGRGSVRQRGGHWYYRFYITDEDGRSVQREFAGGESRWETETMLRRAMADYAQGKRLRTDRLTLGELLDI